MAFVDFTEDDLNSEGGGSFEPGIYSFKVEDIQEKTYRTGSAGYSVLLLVGIGDRDVRVYDNIITNPTPGKKHAKWKLAALCRSVGVDPAGGVDPAQLVGKSGTGDFIREEGSKYLSVGEYVVDAKPTSRSQPYTPTQQDIGNVPF